jgi:predicted transcriptional regulator of viral defense system
MTQSIENKILEYLKHRQKGKIYFTNDFATLGTSESIRKSLSNLVKKDILIRLTQGIYLYPKIDKELGVLYPSVDDVCRAIAKRDKARIEPTGIFALHSLGLSTQIPVNVVYLTDGIPRKIKYGNRTIKFKKTAPKNLAMKGKVSSLVITALKQIGKENVSQEVELQLTKVLKKESVENVRHDAKLAPEWISKLIFQLLNNFEK